MTLNEAENMIRKGLAGLREDSRQVKPGDVFVAVRGSSCDGHDHALEAVEKGALVVICEDIDFPGSEAVSEKLVRVTDTRSALGILASARYNDPAKQLPLYGVTGTNGKSTTVFIIESVFEHLGVPCGMTGTVFNKLRGNSLEKASITTPGAIELNRMLREMVDSGKKAGVMEISSHALTQKRIHGIKLDGAVFTNITPEHLDYHGDMVSYFNAKRGIFKYLRPGGIAVLNADDERVMALMRELPEADKATFGISPGSTVSCADIRTHPDFLEFDILFNGAKAGRVRTVFAGKHNVSNMMAAAALFFRKGFSPEDIIEGLEKVKTVPGRLEKVSRDAPFSVFVDYAHTPDALKNSLECLRAMTRGKLFCVFGCGGDRDTGKRPEMGKVASQISDAVILTDDNPRTEDPDSIISDILRGIPPGTDCSIMRDRLGAIAGALDRAMAGDTVLIAGKGHEDYQIFFDKIIHFSDREAVAGLLDGKKAGALPDA